MVEVTALLADARRKVLRSFAWSFLGLTVVTAAVFVSTFVSTSGAGAVADHGVFHGDTVTQSYPESAEVIADLERLGISLSEVTALLEEQGVKKFIDSWSELIELVAKQVEQSV